MSDSRGTDPRRIQEADPEAVVLHSDTSEPDLPATVRHGGMRSRRQAANHQSHVRIRAREGSLTRDMVRVIDYDDYDTAELDRLERERRAARRR